MFRFTIRELMLVTLVVALGLGWWLHYRVIVSNRQAVIRHAQRVRGSLANARRENANLEMHMHSVAAGNVPAELADVLPAIPSRVDWAVLNEPIP